MTLSRAERVRYVALAAAVWGLYVGAAKLGIELSVAHGVITPVWAPTGIALAALLLFGRRLWPAVALGALIANATSGASILEAAGISVGNTLEAVVGATLLARVGFRPQLDRVRDVLALVFLGACVSTAVAATNGVTTLWISGDVSASDYGSEWLLWWVGDAMGALVVAPFLLVWASAPLPRWSRARTLEALVLLALLIGISCFVFLAGDWRYPHLVFPLLVWAALRFHQRGSVTSSLVVVAIAVGGAVNGSTPLIGSGSATEVVQILEALLATLSVSLLILGAVLAERAEAQTQLTRANAALGEAQEVARIGSWEWDIHSNQVTWSDELYRLYGVDPQSEMTYEAYMEQLLPDEREIIAQLVARAISDGTPFAFDHRIVDGDGRTRWLQGRGRVIRDEAGTPVRMVGTSQDITERKRVDELRDDILATVSHELRTPLTAIIGFALTLQERGSELPGATYRQMLDHLVAQARRLERLLADLLDLDRFRHGLIEPQFRSVDVGALVAQVVAAYPADPQRVEVNAERAVADVDAPKIERIVENLLANALKHTPHDAEISVRVENGDDGVLIVVDDRGPGIPAKDRDAVFELFRRIDNGSHVPGTGVGLSLVAQFTALHGGRAWVVDNPGGGASFRVLLPASRND